MKLDRTWSLERLPKDPKEMFSLWSTWVSHFPILRKVLGGAVRLPIKSCPALVVEEEVEG